MVKVSNQPEKKIDLDTFSVRRGAKRDGALHFSTNGDSEGVFEVPFNGRYTLRINVGADQAGSELAKMSYQLDNQPLKTMSVSAMRDSPRDYDFEMQLSAVHRLKLGFINDFYKSDAKILTDGTVVFYAATLVGPEELPLESLSKLQREVLAVDVSAGVEATKAASRILGPMINRAFRRTVEPAHVNAYANLVNVVMEQGESFARGMQVSLSSVLVSPRFLFRVEGNRNANTEVRDIDQFELASRLSYFLWSSTPDDRLLGLAFSGELSKPRVLESEIERMLIDDELMG